MFLCSFSGSGRNPHRTLTGQPRHMAATFNDAAAAAPQSDPQPPARTRHDRHGNRRAHTQRAYFDEKQSTRNITLIKGQTAHFHCIVRNVGNKSVSSGVL